MTLGHPAIHKMKLSNFSKMAEYGFICITNTIFHEFDMVWIVVVENHSPIFGGLWLLVVIC